MPYLGDCPVGRPGKIRSFCHDLTTLLGHGVATRDTVLAVKERLARLIDDVPDLPERVRRPLADGYARHLLYGDPAGRFEVVVMAWGPGQATPVHDHGGMWCVEGVAEGVIEVTRYDLAEVRSGRFARMFEREVVRAGLGQCGALIPPVEYHRIANPSPALAVTIHVYGGRMRQCRVFEPHDGSTYRIGLKDLHFASRETALSHA